MPMFLAVSFAHRGTIAYADVIIFKTFGNELDVGSFRAIARVRQRLNVRLSQRPTYWAVGLLICEEPLDVSH